MRLEKTLATLKSTSNSRKEIVWYYGTYGWKSMNTKRKLLGFLWLRVNEQERKESGIAIPMVGSS